ncbi:MAG: hypothetical protein ACRDGQ_06495, partial [Candidatus Limnocylindrales bacterium]
ILIGVGMRRQRLGAQRRGIAAPGIEDMEGTPGIPGEGGGDHPAGPTWLGGLDAPPPGEADISALQDDRPTAPGPSPWARESGVTEADSAGHEPTDPDPGPRTGGVP